MNFADSNQDVLDRKKCTVVSAVHHEGVDQPLHDGALGLPEPLGGKPKNQCENTSRGQIKIIKTYYVRKCYSRYSPETAHEAGQVNFNCRFSVRH